MAYKVDDWDNSIVISGFERGIADSPYNGISDMRNVNVISVPGEASVNFATSKISPPRITGSIIVTGLSSNTLSFSAVNNLESGHSIQFSQVGGLTGVGTTQVYWVTGANQTGGSITSCTLASDYERATPVVIGGAATGTPTFTVFNVAKPKHFDKSSSGNYFMIDSLGQVWANTQTTYSGYWQHTGNLPPSASNTHGNGLVVYESSQGVGSGRYVFAFHDHSIDFLQDDSSYSWVYQWNPLTGSTGSYSASPTAVLNSTTGNYSHEAMVGRDNVVYYCDQSFIGSFFEKSGSVFVPTTVATYTFAKKALALPSLDIANCLAELGTNLMVGGFGNAVYPWNRISTSFTYPILLAESVISKLVTVNTNTYIFAGNRGRIYVTNGAQAQLYAKVPDHLSGTVEPFFTWGGATSARNQIYFGLYASKNSDLSVISQYGGLWAIDLDTKAIRLTNELSYADYTGYASALMSIVPVPTNTGNSPGIGMYIGWENTVGSGAGGIDSTFAPSGLTSSPYASSQAYIVSDLIPVGTYQKPRDFERIEYKLSRPLVSGESVTIQQRLIFNTSDTGFTTILTDSTAGNFSGNGPVNFKNAQWLQLKVILNSTASSPSFVRLREIRIK